MDTRSDGVRLMGMPQLSSWQKPGWVADVASRSVRGPSDLALVMLDLLLIATAYAVTLVARHDLAVPPGAWSAFLRFLPIAIVLHLLSNRVAGLYGPVWEEASILEAQRMLLAGVLTTLTLMAGVLVFAREFGVLTALSGGLLATGFMGVLRFQSRLFAFHRRQRRDAPRVLIVGAGESAGAILRELSRHDAGQFQPVGLLDDDPRKLGRWLGGVPIVGTTSEVVEAGRRLEVEQVLLAIPSANSELVREVADATAELEVPLKVLPSVSELLDGKPRLRDVRDLSIDDLLGRQQVATDLDSVRALLHGRRVLVTGGGGSIGSEIVRQVDAYDPAELLVLDRDETHLFDAMAGIGGRGKPILLDLRDRERLLRLFVDQRPEVVFHAAANKHVPLLETHPAEAVATNVLGTDNLVAAAQAASVERVVFISTDKAVNPSSVMGASKRLGEQLVLMGAPEGAAWCAVRFGNVLGSRGSVVPTFVRQIREGGPVTVTHPDMTRFFMSIPEAVQLVLQASAMAQDRGVFMLDMGQPVRILDLAARMIALAGYRVGTDIAIEVTGTRPGEKLAEELHTDHEHPVPTAHPKVVQLHPELLGQGRLTEALRRLADAVDARDDGVVRALLFDVIGREVAAAPAGTDLMSASSHD
jgi:FlaA1/EpsC-like NDP-sugar epimerase